MPYGLWTEPEEKYPKWLRYLAIFYAVVFLWTNFSLPPSGYDFDSALLVALLWLPIPVGLLYVFEKPAIVSEHKKAMRILFVALAAIAIFWGLALSWAFFE